jgi:hypothetical protein
MDMIRTVGLASSIMEATPETSFIESLCLPIVREAQNADGGWGFHVGSQSRVEPTCWALQALMASSWPEVPQGADRGFQYLRAAQLADGSWPFSSEGKVGCWVTSLACWVLLREKDSSNAVAAGLNWLCKDWPRDSSLWVRVLKRFSTQQLVCPINNSYRGWGWTARTSSWVEPTSLAALVLDECPKQLLPPSASRRRLLAESMLYDRMCPGGGWNCGNPLVYGVAGEPLVVPTSWALLALRNHPQRAENVASLDWLEKSIRAVRSGASLALAKICLETYGRGFPVNGPGLDEIYSRNEFLGNVQTAAWTCLAFSKRERWLVNADRKTC